MSGQDNCNCEEAYKDYPVDTSKPKTVLDRLKAGNLNYEAGNLYCVQESREPAEGQAPYAAILSCSDSRVIPERIFDTGPGELFVARVAGNVVNEDIAASFEYSLKPLGTRVIIVLGHASCGAVEAAFPPTTDIAEPGQYTPSSCLTSLVQNIQGAVGSDHSKPIRQNVIGQARKFLHNECIAKTQKPFAVFGAYYDKPNKVVEFAEIGAVEIHGSERSVTEIADPKFE